MPGGLAVDQYSRTLYYSDRYFERIFAVDYSRNGSVRNVFHDKRMHNWHGVVSDFKTCSSGNGGCSDICVADERATKLCLCSDGMTLANGRCSVSRTSDDVLLYARLSPMWIHGVHISEDGSTVTSAIPSLLSSKSRAVFAVDSANAQIYFYVDTKAAIYKRAMDGGNITVVTRNAHHLTCLAFDSTSGNLYYGTRPSAEPAGITVFRPENPDVRLQITKTAGGIHSLQLDTNSRFLFFLSTTQLRQHSISRANLDGTNPKVLVSFFSFQPLTMAIDTADRKVYWLDPFEYALHRIGYDGDDNEERGVRRASPKSDGTFDVATINSLPAASQLAIYTNASSPPSRCLSKNGGCEQLCFPGSCPDLKNCNDDTSKCACASGYVADAKNASKCAGW
ncbi:unnamed protein product [Heligmosomoides polygyrus]|uniref:EGF-like domain-containing protein n=1 Tax=Heligmosomoides polygyrus TaxID=6339 RepID=A0A183GGP4_HELPZ|nr:unnamed protein product [Heligmosomoides polygyrus]